jgi:hypothetical protein
MNEHEPAGPQSRPVDGATPPPPSAETPRAPSTPATGVARVPSVPGHDVLAELGRGTGGVSARQVAADRVRR